MHGEEFFSSEDSVVMNCDPCQYEDKHQEACAFCQDCNEFLCQQCLQSHRKFHAFREHHILRGDSMPKAREVTEPKLVLKFCDNHHMNEVKFYCRNHKSVFCNLCKVVQHQKCEFELINKLTSVTEDKVKFDQVVKKMERLKTDFEQLKASKIEVIDITATNSRIKRNRLDSLRKEMTAIFDELDNELKKVINQEQFYIGDLRDSVAMYSDVINNLTSLSEQTDHVLKSNDEVAVFVALCKLEKIHEDCLRVKESTVLKTMNKPTQRVRNKLQKIQSICESMIHEIETNTQQRPEDKPAKCAKTRACRKRLTKKQQRINFVDNFTTENQYFSNNKSQQLSQVDTNDLTNKTYELGLDKSEKQENHPEETATHGLENPKQEKQPEETATCHLEDSKQKNHPEKTATYGLENSKHQNHTEETTKHGLEILKQQNLLDECSKEAKLDKEIIKGENNQSESVMATVTPDEQKLIFENLHFWNFSYKYINPDGSKSLCDITGSVFLPDGSLVLCDHSSSTVLLYDKDFNMINQRKIKCNVWDVALTDTNEIIVTVNFRKKLVYLTVESGKLRQLKNKISLKRLAWGIAVYKDNILISYHDNPGNGAIEIRQKSGKILRDIIIDDNGERLFDTPYYIDVNKENGDIYVTDSRRNRVTCLSFEGIVLYKIESPEIRWPRKIIHDDNADFLLCSSLANKLLLVKNGTTAAHLPKVKEANDNIKEFLNACFRPQTVSVRKEDHTLIVGLNSSNMMLVLKEII